MLVPAFWSMLGGPVAWRADDADRRAPNAARRWRSGLALIPFVFVVLAFLSEHPSAPGAVLRAMGLAPGRHAGVRFAGDAVTGIVAGVGAGGVAALRMDRRTTTCGPAFAVVFAAVYTFALVRVAGGPGPAAGADLPRSPPSASPTICPSAIERAARSTWA